MAARGFRAREPRKPWGTPGECSGALFPGSSESSRTGNLLGAFLALCACPLRWFQFFYCSWQMS
jgi:hypothetical protein